MEAALPLLAIAALSGSMLAYCCHDYIHTKRLRIQMQKLYASRMFREMAPLLEYASGHDVEGLTVDGTGVKVRYLNGDRRFDEFRMKDYGYRDLSPAQQEAMRAVWEECLPQLRDKKNYSLRRERVELANGSYRVLYHYDMDHGYKSMINRRHDRFYGQPARQSW